MKLSRTQIFGLVAICIISWWWHANLLLPAHPELAIVVTGASSGIGRHAALSLAREGFTVFGTVRKQADADKLQELAQENGIPVERVKPLLMDVTNTEQIQQAVDEVNKIVGDRGLYGLFNNAGTVSDYEPDQGWSVEHVSIAESRRVMNINYFGTLEVTQAFLPLLRKGRGRIINNSSILGLVANPFLSAYCASKSALEALSDSLRRELQPHGVYVSILEAGFIETPMVRTFGGLMKFTGEGVYKETEVSEMRKAGTMGLLGSSTRVTSRAVVHAMRASFPKRRYLVGFMSWPVQFVSWLPAAWQDGFFRLQQSTSLGAVSDEALLEYMEKPQSFSL